MDKICQTSIRSCQTSAQTREMLAILPRVGQAGSKINRSRAESEQNRPNFPWSAQFRPKSAWLQCGPRLAQMWPKPDQFRGGSALGQVWPGFDQVERGRQSWALIDLCPQKLCKHQPFRVGRDGANRHRPTCHRHPDFPAQLTERRLLEHPELRDQGHRAHDLARPERPPPLEHTASKPGRALRGGLRRRALSGWRQLSHKAMPCESNSGFALRTVASCFRPSQCALNRAVPERTPHTSPRLSFAVK